MKDPSWTRAAPFKETSFYRTPSESIANNFTPTASDLKIKNLAKIQKSHARASTISSPRDPTSPRKRTHDRSKSEGNKDLTDRNNKWVMFSFRGCRLFCVNALRGSHSCGERISMLISATYLSSCSVHWILIIISASQTLLIIIIYSFLSESAVMKTNLF